MMKRVVILSITAVISLVFGADEIDIKVRIEGYDAKSGTVRAIGLSGACRGAKIYLTGIDKPIAEDLISKEVFVTLNSSTCEEGKTYKVLSVERE